MEVSLEPMAAPAEGLEAFDLTVNALSERPVRGYLVKPKDAKPGTLPAMLFYHGAGWNDSNIDNPTRAAKAGFLALDINAHGVENQQPASYYKELKNNELKDYMYAGREDRETYYFLGMYLRALRAVDFLTSQPEWDGEVLTLWGSSQGGAQALAVTGLDDRVTAVAANVPAMCDLSGCADPRRAGWPRPVPVDENGICGDAQVLETARYFDTVNFARHITADALFIVGLADTTCPPAGVFAAYNQVQGEKQIEVRPEMGHELPWEVIQRMDGFLKEKAKSQGAKKE